VLSFRHSRLAEVTVNRERSM